MTTPPYFWLGAEAEETMRMREAASEYIQVVEKARKRFHIDRD